MRLFSIFLRNGFLLPSSNSSKSFEVLDENIFVPKPITDETTCYPFNGRRTSFKKAVGILPKTFKGEIHDFDVVPRSGPSNGAQKTDAP